jgi:hypothetical protein
MTTTFTNFLNCTINATGTIGALQAGGNLTGASSIRAAAVTSIKVLGDLASASANAILIIGDLGKASKIDIAGTGTFGTGVSNRIRIQGALNGQISIGTGAKVLNGMFGCVYVTNSLQSSGTLKADAPNPNGWMYADKPNNLTYIVGTTSGKNVGLLFGHTSP